jgi:hypothetical protein
MRITASNPFKGRQHPGELIILCVRLYLRYPLSYEHVTDAARWRADAKGIFFYRAEQHADGGIES